MKYIEVLNFHFNLWQIFQEQLNAKKGCLHEKNINFLYAKIE